MELVAALERLALVGTPINNNEISSSSSSSSRRRKRASVLIPILPNGTILLTQRSRQLRSHGGQVCFPGGRQDDDDDGDDVQTAIRETREEVGLDHQSVRPIGRLPALISQHGLCVTPIIGRVMAKDKDVNVDALVDSLVLSKDEVDAVFVVPLEYFADDANLSRPLECIAWHGDTLEMRTYEYTYQNRSYTIWGLTAYIAHQVAAVATFRGIGRLRRHCCRPEEEDHHATTTTTTTTMPVARWQSGNFSVHQDGEFLIHEELHDHDDRIASSEGHSGRLSLKRIQVNAVAQQEETTTTAKQEHILLPAHSFQVHDLDGGQIWKLAADNETQRLQWIAYLHWSSMRLTTKGTTAAS